MIAHNLFYLPAAMLSDRVAMRAFFVQMRHAKGKSVVVHAPREGQPEDVRFQTKRISAMLSEEMVTNNPFGGDQRQMLSQTVARASVQVRADIMAHLLSMVDVLLLSPLAHSPAGVAVLSAHELLPALAQALKAERHIIFTGNALSPLGQQTSVISQPEDSQRFLAVYPEEEAQISLADAIRPATLLAADKIEHYFKVN